MRSRLNIWKSLLVGVVAMTATTAWAVENDLPQGVSVRTATDGLMLTSSDGRPLYRLDIDRAAKRARA